MDTGRVKIETWSCHPTLDVFERKKWKKFGRGIWHESCPVNIRRSQLFKSTRVVSYSIHTRHGSCSVHSRKFKIGFLPKYFHSHTFKLIFSLYSLPLPKFLPHFLHPFKIRALHLHQGNTLFSNLHLLHSSFKVCALMVDFGFFYQTLVRKLQNLALISFNSACRQAWGGWRSS